MKRLRNSGLIPEARQKLYGQREAIGKNIALRTLGEVRWYEDHQDRVNETIDLLATRLQDLEPTPARPYRPAA